MESFANTQTFPMMEPTYDEIIAIAKNANSSLAGLNTIDDSLVHTVACEICNEHFPVYNLKDRHTICPECAIKIRKLICNISID